MSQRTRVLVVDDEPFIRHLVTEVFEEEGYGIDTAANGAEALEQACRQPPDLIVLDLMMPVMDGWEFLEAWRRQPLSRAVPIVVTSAAYARAGHQHLDVQAFLSKPFDIDQLLATVASLVGPSRSAGDR